MQQCIKKKSLAVCQCNLEGNVLTMLKTFGGMMMKSDVGIVL